MISDDTDGSLGSFAWQSSADNCTPSSSDSEMSPKVSKENGEIDLSEGTHKKAKKRKFIEEPLDRAETMLDHVKKEEDSERKKKKKKSKNKIKQESGESDAADDSYLELRVKQEKLELESKCARRHTHTDTNQHQEAPHKHKSKKKKKKKHQTSVSEHSQSEHETEVSVKQESDNPRKKKPKSEKNIFKHEDMIIEDKFSADETIIQSPVSNYNRKKKKKSKEYIDDSSSAEERDVENRKQRKSSIKDNHIENNLDKDETSKNNGKQSTKKKKSKKDKLLEESASEDQSSTVETVAQKTVDKIQRKSTTSTSSNSTQHIKSQSEDEQSIQTNNHNKASSTSEAEANKSDSDSGAMSEAAAINRDIQGSEDSDDDRQTDSVRLQATLNCTAPGKLARLSERFVFEDDQDEGETAAAGALGSHDEVWVVRCPRGLGAAALAGRALPLSGRTKLQLAGEKYDADAVPAGARAAMVWAGGAAACRVTLQGEITLRRRLPRALSPAAAADAAAERVPLPRTKLRHPLLGANYEEALAPPAAAAAAAAEQHDHSHKKKKKKKRKHSEAEAEAEPAAKRRRAATDTWDSARDIEENLFNF